MKTKLTILFGIIVIITLGVIINKGSGEGLPEPVSKNKATQQVIILLDLSDRITQPGQIECDKNLIQNIFKEFLRSVRHNLIMNSKDRFQICIAPQKHLPFDMYTESDGLTLDLSRIRAGEKLNQITLFEKSLSNKLDELYNKAYKGPDCKSYEGSNIWQFFNETLPSITNDKIVTKLFVITDGYFDFEDRNPVLTIGNLSTTSKFISKVRNKSDWKTEIEKNNYGILPVNKPFKNLLVCVLEIRSKNENNLNETEILNHIWNDWLIINRISKEKHQMISHGSISNSNIQLSEFFKKSL